MKAAGPAAEKLLRAPGPELRAVLLFGPDAGLVRERADTLVAAVAGTLDDPFRVTELAPALIARQRSLLADELRSPPLTGGRRVVRIRDAGTETAAALDDALADAAADGIAAIEAGDLAKSAALRVLCEKSAKAAAIACYVADAEDTGRLARRMLAEAGIAVDTDAEEWLGSALVGDRLLARRELEKLVAFAGADRRLALDAVRSVVGDQSEASLDDLAFALGDRDPAAVDAALGRLLADGAAPVAILRIIQRHVLRLHLALARVAAGEDAMAVSDSLNPFFRNRPRFLAQLRRWKRAEAEAALAVLVEAEERVKQTGIPDQATAGAALLAIARSGAKARAPAR